MAARSRYDSRRPDRIGGPEAARLAATEYQRFGALLVDLAGSDWHRRTDCAAWAVQELVAHVVGATEANASVSEMIRQLRRGRRGLSVEVDPVNAVQVESRRRLRPERLIKRFHEAVPGACRGRARWARYAGRLPMRVGAPVYETWSVRYLMEVIYTRDTWMHRVDLSRAVGADLVLTPDHDGRIVADVVADWLDRHETPVRLSLAGPAGGVFVRGDGGASLELDAVEFCRVVSGRAAGDGPLALAVPF
jgi:uncharacterized protein (TIGR03083 family)